MTEQMGPEQPQPEQPQKPEAPVRFEDVVETEGLDTGRIKDEELARKMAEAEKKYQEKKVAEGSLADRIRIYNNSEQDEKAKKASDKVFKEEMHDKVVTDLQERGFMTEAAEKRAKIESDKYEKIPDYLKAEEERQLNEIREKIANDEGEFKLSDTVETEGSRIGNIKDKGLAREMADIETRPREKSGLLKRIWHRVLGKYPTEEQYYQQQVKSGQAEADKLAEDTIRTKAQEAYGKGYWETTAKKAGDLYTEQYKSLGARRLEEITKEQAEIDKLYETPQAPAAEAGPPVAPPAEAPSPTAGEAKKTEKETVVGEQKKEKKKEKKKKDKEKKEPQAAAPSEPAEPSAVEQESTPIDEYAIITPEEASKLTTEERIARLPEAWKPHRKLNESELTSLEDYLRANPDEARRKKIAAEYQATAEEGETEMAASQATSTEEVQAPEEVKPEIDFSEAASLSEVYGMLRQNEGLMNTGRSVKDSAQYWINLIELNRSAEGTVPLLDLSRFPNTGGFKDKVQELLKKDKANHEEVDPSLIERGS